VSVDIRVIDPLTDPRWVDLLERHPHTSVFHSRGWLEALKRTYGYEPIALTTTPRGPLENGLAVCRVRTWTSRRLVSLPFSDHCDPLVERADDLSVMLAYLADQVRGGVWRSFELRPRAWTEPYVGSGSTRDERAAPLTPTKQYALHEIDLSGGATEVFRRFHPSCVRRAVRRAEREGLRYERGRSEVLLSAFYGLFRTTRHRLGMPPPPLVWFRNLIACLGNEVTIHVAWVRDRPIAAILTMSFARTLVYKFGGSDARDHRLGGMPFLFWRAIQEAVERGVEVFDLGRSDLDQSGLIAFKDHLGARRSTMTYVRHPRPHARQTERDGALALARHVFTRLPEPASDLAGRILYRHLG
jgi:CelD/BcsL family acetyltransferase involved in cellulose biosynthesis